MLHFWIASLEERFKARQHVIISAFSSLALKFTLNNIILSLFNILQKNAVVTLPPS